MLIDFHPHAILHSSGALDRCARQRWSPRKERKERSAHIFLIRKQRTLGIIGGQLALISWADADADADAEHWLVGTTF